MPAEAVHLAPKLLLIAAGGAVGSVGRYLIGGWAQQLAHTTFPIGTMAVNVIGCAIIGVLAALFAGPYPLREELRIALTIGVLGGFTTFSTFSIETIRLASDGAYGRALLYVLLTNILCVGGAWLGYRLAGSAFGS